MIRLANLDRFYEAGPTRTYVLRRINLEIREEFVTIMGPSGAGKSTLLSIIGMLDNAWTENTGSSTSRCTSCPRRSGSS